MRSLLCTGAIVTGAVPATGLLAQAAPAPAQADGSDGQIADIVVTAQRRAERLQDVPIAVTALSGDTLKEQGVQTTADLTQVVPGLSFNTQLAGFGQPRIRGVGTAASGPGLENPVAVYIDGVYYGAQSGSLLDLSDISQVAVLKGPQGTLFGRNATGGLIQVTTRDPGHDFTGDLSATIGTYKTVGADAYLAGGLSDKIANGLTFHLDNQYDGFGKNFYNGQDVQTHRSLGLRDKLLFEPDDLTKITLEGAYSRYTTANTAMNKVDNAVYPAGFGPWDVDLDQQPYTNSRLYNVSLTAQRDFGRVRAMSITAYTNSRLYTIIDADQLPAKSVMIDILSSDKAISQEFQLSSIGGGRFSWVAGLFYYQDESGYVPIDTHLYATNTLITLNSDGDVHSYAAYGQGTYKITDTTNFTAGLRYTIDHRSFDGTQLYQAPTFTVPSTTSAEHTFRKVTWRLALDHHFSSSILAYASYNRGFKSGFYEPQTIPALLLKPETLDAYEVGLKSDLFDRKVRFNIAGFYNDYKNVQVTQIYNSRQTVFNGDGSKAYGMDMDLTVNPVHNLVLTGGLSLIHGRYGAFNQAFISQINPAGGNIITVGPLPSGKKLQNTPAHTVNLSGNYTIPSEIGSFIVGAAYYINSGYYSEPENRLRQPAFSVLDATLTWRSPNKRFDIQVAGKNLTNKAYASQLNASGTGDNRQTAAPRTVKVTAGVHF